jgi:hypothetical protein
MIWWHRDVDVDKYSVWWWIERPFVFLAVLPYLAIGIGLPLFILFALVYVPLYRQSPLMRKIGAWIAGWF